MLQPDFFRMIVAVHVMFIKPMYFIILFGFLTGSRKLSRTFTLFAAPALLYSMVLCIALLFLGPQEYRVQDHVSWIKFNGDYVVVPLLAWARNVLLSYESKSATAAPAPAVKADRKTR